MRVTRMRKILLRCAGRACEAALFVPMDEALLANALMRESWVFARASRGLQPVCWQCALKLELSPADLDRVRKVHQLAQRGKGVVS